MLFAKVVTVIVAGILTAVTVRRLMNTMNAAKVRVNPRQDTAVTKLRQDPSTGIYYPDN